MMFNIYTITNVDRFKLFVRLTNFCKVTNMRRVPFFVLFLFVLIACQEQGTGPVMTTIYIEEVVTSPLSITIDPKTERNINNQIEKSQR